MRFYEAGVIEKLTTIVRATDVRLVLFMGITIQRSFLFLSNHDAAAAAAASPPSVPAATVERSASIERVRCT